MPTCIAELVVRASCRNWPVPEGRLGRSMKEWLYLADYLPPPSMTVNTQVAPHHDTDEATMAATADKSKPYIPLSSGADDGWSKEDSAIATCYCGTVQLSFPTQGPGLLSTFLYHCTDCRKFTASMFATNFSVADTSRTHPWPQ